MRQCPCSYSITKVTQSRLLKLHMQCEVSSFFHLTYTCDTTSLYKRNQASCTQWLNPRPPAFGPASLRPPPTCPTRALTSRTTAADNCCIPCSFLSGPGEERPVPKPGTAARPSPRGAVPQPGAGPGTGPRPPRSCAPGPRGSPAPGGRRSRPPHRPPPRASAHSAAPGKRCPVPGPPGLTSLPSV